MCYNISMWTKELIEYWCSHYQQLRDYELNPFEEIRIWFNEAYVTGQMPSHAPYEDTCDLNWEFDKALKKLGNKEAEFRRLYLDGEDVGGEDKDLTLFNEFVKILMEVSDDKN